MAIRVQPRELQIPDDDPFGEDLLDRRESVEVLTDILGSIDGPCVLAVDAAWGTGKTTFLKMWAKHLQIQGFAVVEFNAWETDFSGDPFLALSSEVTASLSSQPSISEDRLVRPLKRATKTLMSILPGPAFRIAASMIPIAGPQVIKELEAYMASAAENSTSRYMDAKEAVQEFRRILEVAAQSLAKCKASKPLVVVIDELDRCRPSYAVELLEVAKHLFMVDKIAFVLAIDRTQLTHSIKVLYGNEFDAEGYLGRFFDIDYRLPEPDRAKFLRAMLVAVGISNYLDKLSGEAYAEIRAAVELLKDFFVGSHFSLREVGQAIHRLGLVLASSSNEDWTYARTITVLMMMRMVNRDLYRRFIAGEMTDEALVQGVFKSPGFSSLHLVHHRSVVEAVIIAAKRESVREEIDAGRRGAFEDAVSLDQPLYRRYYDLQAEDSSNDQKLMEEKRHADSVLRIVREFEGWVPFSGNPGVGFRRSVRRLELLSSNLRDEEQ